MNSVARKLRTLRCRTLFPTDVGFFDAIALDNGRSKRVPLAIVMPQSTTELCSVIAIAAEEGIPVTAKSGGHSYNGYCIGEGAIVVDLQLMKQICISPDGGRLHVEMGCRWRDVYTILQQEAPGKLAIGGACDGVGVAGFILGGGYSFVSRSYGLASDSILELEVVTGTGRILRISADASDPDERNLFWACCGGGGGNFGIVTSAVLRLHSPRQQTFLAGEVYFPIDRLEQVLHFYDRWAPTLPNEMSVYGLAGVVPLGKLTGASALRLQPVYNGSSREGIELLAPLLALSPTYVSLSNLPLLDYVRDVGQTTSIAGQCAYTRSGVMHAGAMNQEFVHLVKRGVDTRPSHDSFLLWMHQGGYAAASGSVCSFPHRNAEYVFEICAVWSDKEDPDPNIDWAYCLGEKMEKHFFGAYINYIDPLLRDWKYRYYGENAELLAEIASLWDPQGVFNFQQGIRSKFEPQEDDGRLDRESLDRTFIE